MTETNSPGTQSNNPIETRTDEEVEASIETKIQSAIAAAVSDGSVDADQQIGVMIDTDGSIRVGNVDTADDAQAPSQPDLVELPAMFCEDRESLTDSHYAKHLETHWGF